MSISETQEYLTEQVTRELYARVARSTDPATVAAVSRLLGHARALHRSLDIEHVSPGVQMLLSISGAGAPANALPIHSLAALVDAMPSDRPGMSIWILPNNTYKVEYHEVTDNVDDEYVKYMLIPFEREEVITHLGAFDIAPLGGLISPFAFPYFRDLDAALAEYYTLYARRTTCPYLREAWADPAQLVLTNKPEKHMRRSLYYFLFARLRDAKPAVLQEQNVNETEPVDIRIQWLDAHRVSLIEVKWVGDSVSEDGTEVTTKYRDSRAKDGYRQACEYMLEQRGTLPSQIVRSRLVVFDARRKGLAKNSDGVFVCANAWAYRDREIDYTDVSSSDPGVEAPVRYFLEPAEPRAA